MFEGLDLENMALGFARDVIYDSMLPEPRHVADAFGCPPVSDEVEEMIARESDYRVERIEILMPFILAYSSTVTKAIVGYQKHADPETPPESLAVLNAILIKATVATLTAALSSMVDLEVIKVNTEKS